MSRAAPINTPITENIQYVTRNIQYVTKEYIQGCDDPRIFSLDLFREKNYIFIEGNDQYLSSCAEKIAPSRKEIHTYWINVFSSLFPKLPRPFLTQLLHFFTENMHQVGLLSATQRTIFIEFFKQGYLIGSSTDSQRCTTWKISDDNLSLTVISSVAVYNMRRPDTTDNLCYNNPDNIPLFTVQTPITIKCDSKMGEWEYHIGRTRVNCIPELKEYFPRASIRSRVIDLLSRIMDMLSRIFARLIHLFSEKPTPPPPLINRTRFFSENNDATNAASHARRHSI